MCPKADHHLLKTILKSAKGHAELSTRCNGIHRENYTSGWSVNKNFTRTHVLIARARQGECDKYMGPSEVFFIISRPLTSVSFIFNSCKSS